MQPTQNRLYLIPLEVSGAIAIEQIAVSVSTLQSGTSVRLGIYDNSGTDGRPSKLICQGSAAVSTTSTGNKTTAGLVNSAGGSISEATISYPFAWLAIVAQGTIGSLDLLGHDNLTTMLPNGDLANAMNEYTSMYYMSSVSGALPAEVTISGIVGGEIPRVLLKRKS